MSENEADKIAPNEGETPKGADSIAGQIVKQDIPLPKRAAKIRHLVRLGMSGSEICRQLHITRSAYRHAIRWMSQDGFRSNAEAFATLRVETQATLEQIALDMQMARQQEDMRAVAALHKISNDSKYNLYEMALKLGVLDREAVKIQQTVVEVKIGDESAKSWYELQDDECRDAVTVNGAEVN